MASFYGLEGLGFRVPGGTCRGLVPIKRIIVLGGGGCIGVPPS